MPKANQKPQKIKKPSLAKLLQASSMIPYPTEFDDLSDRVDDLRIYLRKVFGATGGTTPLRNISNPRLRDEADRILEDCRQLDMALSTASILCESLTEAMDFIIEGMQEGTY